MVRLARVEIIAVRREPAFLAKCTVCDLEWSHRQTATTYAKLHAIETGHTTTVERISGTTYEVKKR